MSQQHLPSGAHILVVEDDETARISLVQLLLRAGYHVDAVADGETAYELLDRSTQGAGYDVVLTDLLLREVDGIQVMRRARALADAPEVVLLTGFGTIQTAIEAIRLGACDYLLKPCRPDDLLSCVHKAYHRRMERRDHDAAVASIAYGIAKLQGVPAALAEAPHVDPGQIQIGALHIDRQRHSTSFAGELVELTPTEYAILCCLADNADRMVPYDELAREVYGRQLDERDSHTLLKTHMHNLRRKIAADLIVNVRGVGYRLLADSTPSSHPEPH